MFRGLFIPLRLYQSYIKKYNICQSMFDNSEPLKIYRFGRGESYGTNCIDW